MVAAAAAARWLHHGRVFNHRLADSHSNALLGNHVYRRRLELEARQYVG